MEYYRCAKGPRRIVYDMRGNKSYGLGGVLLQLHGETWRPVAYCSRTLNMAECRYAQIEKELLAATWTCEKFAKYLVGLPAFTLQTDHKPLIPLINKADIDATPIRCQRLLMRLMRFNARAEYIPGKQLEVADTLSRSPIDSSEQELSEEIKAYVDAVIRSKPMTDLRLEEIRSLTEEDDELQEVIFHTLHGWPKYKKEVDSDIHKYYDVRHELSIASGLLLRGSRIIVPDSLRKDILDKIHDGHWGISKCRERAAQSVWWPGLNTEIQHAVSKCPHCQTNRANQAREPLLPTVLPDCPWQKVGLDLCEHKKKVYLVAVDYHSRYLVIVYLPDMKSLTTIAKMKTIFAHWGIPVEVFTDNGPQFASHDFKTFARAYGFRHTTSSPHYPRSNGEAERAVQMAKKILGQPGPWLALMTYRATPTVVTGQSPARLMMGREIRTTMPVLPTHLMPYS